MKYLKTCFILLILISAVIGCKEDEPVNQPPLANAGQNVIVNVGSVANLDASASSDPEDASLTYSWIITSAPQGSSASLSSNSGANISFTPDVDGVYDIELTVSDGDLADTDIVQITAVSNAPVANAGEDQEVDINTQVTLDGNGSVDPEGDPLSYSWIFQSKPTGSNASISNADQETATFTPDEDGDYVVTLSVTDGFTAPVTDEIIITAILPGAPPVADAGEDLCNIPGSDVALDGTASSDPDGDPIIYNWTIVQTVNGSSASITDETIAKPVFTTDQAGQYRLALEVSDGYWDPVYDTVDLNIFNPTVVDDLDLSQAQTIPNLCDERSVPDAYLNDDATGSAVLTIEPGVRMEMAQNVQLEINANGTLKAEGTEALPIDIVGKDSTQGFWDEIVIDSDKDNVFDYVNVAYGGGGTYESNVYLARESTSQRKLSVTNSSFSTSAGSGFTLNNVNSSTRGGEGTLVSFSNNSFSNNIGDGLIVAPSNLVELNNDLTFENNNRDGVVVDGGRSIGNVVGNWQAYVYFIDRRIALPGNASIDVKPGTEFYFSQDVSITIDGATFTAEGTTEKPIIFNSQQPGTVVWSGIEIGGSGTNPGEAIMDHVEIAHGGSNLEGNVEIGIGSLSLSNATVSNGKKNGIYQSSFSDSEIALLDNVIFKDNAEAGLYIQTRSLVNVKDNLTFTNNSEDRIIVDGTRSSNDGTWPGYRYLIDGSITVNSSIEVVPGAIFEFDQGYVRVDGGSLNAIGTNFEPIVFTAAGDNKTSGSWFGIQFTSSTAKNTFDYVEISYGGAGSDADNANLEICIDEFSLTNSFIAESAKYGLFISNGTTMNSDYLSSNTFSNNGSGDEINGSWCPPLK